MWSHILNTNLNLTWVFGIRCSKYGAEVQIVGKYDISMILGILQNLLIGCVWPSNKGPMDCFPTSTVQD